MIKKNTIRLNESELKHIIYESVKKIVKEQYETYIEHYELALNRLYYPDEFDDYFSEYNIPDEFFLKYFPENILLDLSILHYMYGGSWVDSVEIINKDEIKGILSKYLSPQDIDGFFTVIKDWAESDSGSQRLYELYEDALYQENKDYY